jgi:ankyrin repeat protein
MGNKSIVKTLLRGGADPSVVNTKTGRTCLMYASEGGHMELVKLLCSLLDMTTVDVISWTDSGGIEHEYIQ